MSAADPIVICPTVDPANVGPLRDRLRGHIECDFWHDAWGIGSDLAYQFLWRRHAPRDVIILHTDMDLLPSDPGDAWLRQLLGYVARYPEAGMFGSKMLYPVRDHEGRPYVQHAGGRFEEGRPVHFGGGVHLRLGFIDPNYAVVDRGQFDRVREVGWLTFAGLYMRRALLDAVGDYDPRFTGLYYRDVDYCLTARNKGFRLYQTPATLLHAEGRDNRRLLDEQPELERKVEYNKQLFTAKWAGRPDLLTTVDRDIGPP
jgi:GT2 family glycosyltransferase